jgi:hypothetical protein
MEIMRKVKQLLQKLRRNSPCLDTNTLANALTPEEFHAWIKRGPKHKIWRTEDPLACPVAEFLNDFLEYHEALNCRAYVSSRWIHVLHFTFDPPREMGVRVVATFPTPRWVAALVRRLEDSYHAARAAEVLRVLKDLGYTQCPHVASQSVGER